MNRVLQIVNFIGVLLVAGLCALQWYDNGQLHAQGEDLERTRQEQAAKIAGQDKAIQGCTADLDDLRGMLSKSDAELKDTQAKLAAETAGRNRLAAARDELTAERDQLKSAIEKWAAAVAQRDDALKQLGDQVKQANEQLQKLTADRNDTITKYNNLVNEMNARAKAAGAR